MNGTGGHLLSSLFCFFSALFSLPSKGPTLFCAIPPAQRPLKPCPLSCCCSKFVRRPSHLDRACVSLLASLFSLLSFLCSLPSSLLGLDPFRYHPVILRPNHCVLRPCHLDRACFSLLASLFSFLCSLPSSLLGLLSQNALRTCHSEVCIRPANPPPIHSPPCLTMPGPTACAKR